mgnify:FL=1
MELVRVLRIVEYVGSRERVEETVRQSIHGDKVMKDLTIRAATIGTYPEILEVRNESQSEGGE